MNSVIFKNKGIIDIKAITTFGISSKENSSAIGYFGTGLKYAIAILLREGCEITIYSGEDKYEFTTKRQSVRVNEFDFVQMNGENLAFTTELGKNWELWQAYRELYCNCKDEFGVTVKAEYPDSSYIERDFTTIIVTGKEFVDIHDDSKNIILNSKPISTVGEIEIHPGNSEYLFYKGVRVGKLPKPSIYTYNILFSTVLTEDRTINDIWAVKYNLLKHLVKETNTKIIQELISAHKSKFEFDFDFDMSGYVYSEVFFEYAKTQVKTRQLNVNLSLIKYVKQQANLEQEMYVDFELTKIQEKAFNKAVKFLSDLNYPVTDYKIRFIEDLGTGYLGLAKDNTIYLSKDLFLLGTKQIASCLLEEYIHLKHRLRDETRELQTFLFDTIISMGELLIEDSL